MRFIKYVVKAFPAIFAVAAFCLVIVPSARAASITYVLKDLRFDVPGGENGIVNPISILEPGVDGHFVWTYPAGDFQGGVGTLLDLTLPFTTFPLSSAITSVDLTGITGAQPGNTHNLTYDFTIRFLPALSGPAQTVGINPTASNFDFTGNWFYAPGLSFSGEWIGNITSGTVSPVPEPSTAWLLGIAMSLFSLIAMRQRLCQSCPARD